MFYSIGSYDEATYLVIIVLSFYFGVVVNIIGSYEEWLIAVSGVSLG